MGFFSAAIEPQRLGRHIVANERLLTLFEEIGKSRVTTVNAPAGYGKTSAMTHWAQNFSGQRRKVLWIAPRGGVSSAESLIAALNAAFQQAEFNWQDARRDLSTAADFADLIGAQPTRPVLIVDDAQLLEPAALELIGEIVTMAHDALTTIIAGRGAPRIQVARLHSLGLLFEVKAEDLRFSYEEAAAFAARNAVPMGEAALREVVDDTKGWVAGIAMACARTRFNGSNPGTPKSGALTVDIEQYFAEEVMLPQPERIRQFIVSTAILEEITPNACAGVTELADARRMLETVESSGLFIERVDVEKGVYVYHPLFRMMVLRRLKNYDPERAFALHRRASMHFAAHGQARLAVEHAAQAGDPSFLADQLEDVAEPLIYDGHLYRMEELSAPVPQAVLATKPMLLLALAWRNIRRLDFTSAEKLIALASRQVERQHAEGEIDDYRHAHLQRTIDHRRVMLDAAQDDMPKVEQSAAKLLADLGDDYAYLSCTLLAQLMAARRELYHFQDIQKLEAEIRRALSRPGAKFASIALKASIAPTLVVQGKTEAAQNLLEEALALACDLQGEGSGLAALPALPLAELLYDHGDLVRASQLVEAHIPVARLWGFVDQLAAGHLVHARLLVAHGDIDGALKGLEEANLVAIECGLDRLRTLVVAEQVRILVRCGRPAQAQILFDNSGLAPEVEPFPTLNPLRRSESIAIAWLRLEIQNNRLARARKIATRWCELARRTGVLRSAVSFELLLAEIAVQGGNRSEARRAVREAVTLAAPAGWTRIFLDEGDVIGALITEAYGQGPVLDTPPDRFGARLVAAFKGGAVPEIEEEGGLGSKLVNRELDILGMVAGGLRNREIGNRLGLTEGTVKWYMQQIYDKLGVRRRPQAVMRARQLGVLP